MTPEHIAAPNTDSTVQPSPVMPPVSGDLVGEAEPAVYSLDGNSLPDWAYADDFVLLAYTAEGLQRLTGAAARAFLRRRLKLEPTKCVVLSVNVPAGEAVTL
jgi:hypothetical protein